MPLTLDEVREKYPDYKGVPDDKLLDALHRKFYQQMPIEEFNRQMSVKAKEQPSGQILEKKDRTLLGAAGEAVTNIPSSAGRFAQSVVQPVVHPVETYQNFKNIGKGVLQHLGLVSGEDSEKYADAVGEFFKDRYGSFEGIKKTLAEDPIGLAADISLFLSLGGGIAARAPGVIGQVGEAAATAGRITDPLNAAAQTVKGAGTVAGKVASNIIDYRTHVGERPIGEAFKAGAGSTGSPMERAGAREFQENMRGIGDPEEAVNMARAGVRSLEQQAAKAYNSGMIDIKNDYHILDFGLINQAFKEVENVGRYKGVELRTPNVLQVRDRMTKIVDDWKGYAPAQYHTPEGFDRLKVSLGYILEEQEKGTAASLVAGKIYNSVKETINQQAPTYAIVMKAYEEAKGVIRETERELAGKRDAPMGPALKKLQSVMRNNVHTNWGNREKLAELLVENGAVHMIQAVAGQALNTWKPRSFGRLVGAGELIGGVYAALLGHPAVLAFTMMALPTTSPRLMGEAAYYAGKFYGWTGRAADKLATPARIGGEASFQAGRLAPVKYDASGNPIQQAQ